MDNDFVEFKNCAYNRKNIISVSKPARLIVNHEATDWRVGIQHIGEDSTRNVYFSDESSAKIFYFHLTGIQAW
jgi:uncharacterized protein YukJ